MKQHYNKCFCALLAILLTAACFVNVQKAARLEKTEKLLSPSGKPSDSHSSPADEKTLASIQQSLAKREYNISFDSEKQTLQSPNRKQGIRAYYKPGVLTVNNRVDSAGHNFSLKLVNEGIFADGKKILSPQASAVSENIDNKLVIKHKGFSEEFINNEEGVRQNFIIDAAPIATKELQVRLSAQGLKVNDLQNNELQFTAQNKKGELTGSLIYKDIKCWDAAGKTLPATLRYEEGLVRLSVNVQNASYPVTIDPIVVNGNPANAVAMVESNQATAWMGGVVASAGDVNGDGYSDILVNASKYDNGQIDEGAVFIYHGTASGINAVATVMLEGDQKDARFGGYVSSAGDINKDGFSDIVVGALFYDKGQTNEGAAFVYYGSAQGISKAASVILESNQPEANMGNSVGLAGDVNGDGYSDILVGARTYDNGQSNEGVVFLYHGSAAGLNTTPVLIEQNQPEALFGFCATGAGDVNGDGYSDIIIGARTFDKGETDEGAVFIYHGSANGINPAAAATVLESNQKDAYLGHAAASAGDVNGDGYSDIIIGANMYDKGQTNEGAAFIHYGSAQGINAVAALVVEKNQAEAQLGYSVASAGDVNGDGYADVIIGSPQYDNGQTNEGAAFIYHGSSTGLSATPVSTLESNQAGAQFGSVSSAGDVNGDGYSDVVVGAIVYSKGQSGEGGAFVWLGMPDGVSNVAALKLEGNQNDAQMGWSISDAGDVNGDGFDDVAIAANGYDNGQVGEGAVFIYHGSKAGLNPVSVTTIEGNEVYASMGKVASAGDVNGDGYGDIIIGIPLYGQNNSGVALIYHGSQQGIESIVKTKIEGEKQEEEYFGSSVSGAGDINGDGFSDIIIGSSGLDIAYSYSEEGAAYIHYGSSNGININPVMMFQGTSTEIFLGRSVNSVGDINGDGFDDVAISKIVFADQVQNICSIYVGSSTGLDNSAILTLEGSVDAVGDVNGDGLDDIGQSNNGKLQIYYGSINNVGSKSELIDSNEFANYGSYLTSAGDVNGDGYSDIIVGALGYSNGQNNEGAAYIYLGSVYGVNSNSSFKVEGNQEKAFMGHSVSGAGDINGDGYSDVIMGAHQHDNGQTNEGMVHVYHGNAGTKNLQNNLRLYNSNLTTPINQTQKAKNDFGAGLYSKSFLGRNKGKMVWETKAKGQGFSKGANNVITNSTVTSGSQVAYVSLGLTGTELKGLIAKQGASTKVRVRVKYDPALALTGQVYGPWRYLPSYLLGNSIAPAPEDVVDDMSETVKRKATASEDSEQNKVMVYPNPVSDKLFIETANPDVVSHMQLYTLSGKSVNKTVKNSMDVRGIESGVYILVVSRKDGSRTSHKVAINY